VKEEERKKKARDLACIAGLLVLLRGERDDVALPLLT
jgi:hypothetical protein